MGGGGARPGFGEGGGQRVVQEPPEQRPGGQAHGERGQDGLARVTPAEGGEPAQLDGEDRGQDRGEEELRQCGEHGRADARPGGDEPPPGAAPECAGDEGESQEDGDGE